MKKITLSDLVSEIGQAGAAKALGVSAPAIAKALSAGREIYVTKRADGSFSAEELRPFPSQTKPQAA
jgi:hypothetical protein